MVVCCAPTGFVGGDEASIVAPPLVVVASSGAAPAGELDGEVDSAPPPIDVAGVVSLGVEGAAFVEVSAPGSISGPPASICMSDVVAALPPHPARGAAAAAKVSMNRDAETKGRRVDCMS